MPQTVAVPAAQPGMQQVQVQVSPGMVSGQILTVDPDGPQGLLQPVQVRIPAGVVGGQIFTRMIPAQQPVAVVTAVNPVAVAVLL